MADTANKPIFKKWWFWVGAIVIGIVVLGSIIRMTASKQTLAEWDKQDSIKKVQAKLDEAENERKSWLPMGCKYLPIGKDSANVYYTETDTWTIASLIRNHFNKGIQFSRKAFAGDSSLKVVEFSTKSVLKDKNGNLDTAYTIWNTFSRDKFLAIKWENFKNQIIYDQIERSADDIYFHPAIRKSVTEDELKADLYLE